MKDAATYEHVSPAVVGNARRVLVSELSGKSNLLYKAREMGMDLSQHEEELKVALKHLKKLEHEGYEFEAAEASLRVLLESAVHGETEFELRTSTRPGMREVADRAGVAMSSVSRVLSGHPDVSPKMRRVVMALSSG